MLAASIMVLGSLAVVWFSAGELCAWVVGGSSFLHGQFGGPDFRSGWCSVILPVLSVGNFVVHVFGCNYFRGERASSAFYTTLSVFVLVMAGLLVSDNLVVFFVFWEVVAFTSFLLISHWSAREKAGVAALKSVVVNRVPDI